MEFRPVKAERTNPKVEKNSMSFQILWIIRNFGSTGEETQSQYYQIDKSKVQFVLFWNNDESETYLQISFFATDTTTCGNIRITFSRDKVVSELVKLAPTSRKFLINLKHSREDLLEYVRSDDVLTLRIDIPITFAERASGLTGIPVTTRRRLSSEFSAPKRSVVCELGRDGPKNPPPPPSKTSKEQTGHVGLMNQGATCYMNSMLQSLFHLPAFRRLVFDLPTTGMEDVEKSIPLNLQRLFCRLQLSEIACSTKALTTSLGWTSRETFVQHDVQEFERVLIDNLERKLEGTFLESSIATLFRGEFVNYIRCKDVPYQSTRKEFFYDLSMQVRGCASLLESFEKYVEPEEMTGSNQYKTDDYGPQDAIMGTEFAFLPSVLHLHLRRFEFDYATMRMAKVNDTFAFPKQIDLSKFVNDKSKSYVYDLFGVLVHSGGTYGGHYYAFLRTSSDPQWYKFNDSVVTKESEENAIDDNFGGKAYNAYMLIYVRHEDVEHLYEPVTKESIPQHLVDYVEAAEKEEEEKRQELIKESKTAVINISTEDDLRVNTEMNVSGFKPQTDRTVSVEKQTTLETFYEIIGKELSVPVENLRIWEAQYSRMPYRLLKPLETANVGALSYVFLQKSLKSLNTKTFVDDTFAVDANQCMVFVKFFFQDEEQIAFISSCKVELGDPVSSLIATTNRYLGLPEETRLLIFQESLNSVHKKVDGDATFKSLGIRHGAVLILQLPPGEPFPVEHSQYIRPKDASDGQREAINGIVPVTYRDVFPERHPQLVDDYLALTSNMKDVDVYDFDVRSDSPAAIVRVSSSLSFVEFKKMLSKLLHLDYSPDCDAMILYKCTDAATLQTSRIETALYQTLRLHLQTPPKTNGLERHRFYFQMIRGTSEEAVANSAQFHVQFSEDGFVVAKDAKVLAFKTENCLGIFQKLGIDCDVQNLRFLRVRDHRIFGVLRPEEEFGNGFYSLRVDVVPMDQRDTTNIAFFLPVAYGYIDAFLTTRAKGDPFLFPVITGEQFSSTKERLAKSVNLDGASFRFKRSGDINDSPLPDETVLSDVAGPSSTLFVLIGEDARPKPAEPPQKTAAPPVRIYN